MNDPVKIIFKYKNNNRHVQYNINIFIGDVSSKIMSILNKIKDETLYNSFIKLQKNEIMALEKFYGNYWYKYFYNTYHITHVINNIRNINAKKREIQDKFGKEWVSKHIDKYQYTDKKIYYSYSSKIRREYDEKFKKREMIDEEIIVNYKTLGTSLVTNTINSQRNIKIEDAGYINSDDDLDSDSNSDSEYNYNQAGGEEDETGNETGNEKSDEPVEKYEFSEGLESYEVLPEEEDIDIDEIAKLYKDVDVDSDNNIKKTSELIKKAVNDAKIQYKTEKKMIEFDISKDDYMHTENLRDIYKKNYITTQYIFKDDTVKMVKNKICCSIKNNKKFGKDAFITPSRQYMWSEYFFDDTVEKVMIGQKWIHRSELLKIDVEPNINIHFYEELRGNLKLLRDNIRRYGSKIKREDDDNNILYDYEGYFINNEIYMIDIYNELGLGYDSSPNIIKNITDVYIRIYFPKIWVEDIQNIIGYLGKSPENEQQHIEDTYDTLNNDLIVENEIMKTVESIKKTTEYKHIFKGNYITQFVIHFRANIKEGKLDLYRIFNEFRVTSDYPLIQYQTIDGRINFKYDEDEINKFIQDKNKHSLLVKWFENAPYGISFKVKIKEGDNEKFVAIKLTENGRVEYKWQWKEEDMATIDDIKQTYNYIRALITKLNSEKNKVTLNQPIDSDFKYAFINSIQQFVLPDKFVINHNDLSEFSRYFYPYVALVIEPRKRVSKIKKAVEKGKFGTYLRYKRISKYENKARIRQRILYFMRNYEYNDKSLALEIGKQFNITSLIAMNEIDRVRKEYPNIKKSRKILKKLENIPKYRPPGIGIDIQGKLRNKYKIRISGARDKLQLDRMMSFMNVLIWLYIETYLYKKKDRQVLKEKLKLLTNIASRRNKVDEVVNYEKIVKDVKKMAQLDKKRVGYKPEKGQSQWSRLCQNSGKDKRRRPQLYTSTNLSKLVKAGYKINKNNGLYEKTITTTGKKGKKDKVVLRVAKLQSLNDPGQPGDKDVYYTCNPDENGQHMHVGFLTRSNNPFNQCMPCCFKNDHFLSANKDKQNYFLNCIGQNKVKKESTSSIVGDILYILQDTNKIQEGRLSFLPNYLDFFFNYILGKTKEIKHHHYLTMAPKGYYFKLGTMRNEYPFLNAVAAALDVDINFIKNKIITVLNDDKNNRLFTSLNNGDLKTRFGTKESYIKYIKNDKILDFNFINNIISTPGVLHKNGINIILFNKVTKIIKRTLEKEITKEDFAIMCQDKEYPYNITDPLKINIFIIKENKNYNPVIMITKKNELDKKITKDKIFMFEDKADNIVNNIYDFYKHNCVSNFLGSINEKQKLETAKQTYITLLSINNEEYHPKYQIVDTRNKAKYIITKNLTIVPVLSSGTVYSLMIVKNIENQYIELNVMIKQLKELYKLSNKTIPVNPVGIYYDKFDKNKDIIHYVAIMTNVYTSIPIIPKFISVEWTQKNGLIMQNQPVFDKIDKEIEKGKENIIIDNRILKVNTDKYDNDSYELFRLEFSNFINTPENEQIKGKIERLINNKKMIKSEKKINIKKFLFKLIDKNLFHMYEKYIKNNAQSGGKYDKFIHIVKTKPNITVYKSKNIRDVCKVHKNRDNCNNTANCRWSHDKCYLALTDQMIITFIDKISEEFVAGDNKELELLQKDDYFVNDIADFDRFTEHNNQKIITSTNTAVKKVLKNIFGQDHIPHIGRRKRTIVKETDEKTLNIENPIKDMKDFYSQNIIENNISIFRAFTNGFHWIKHYYYDISSRNLGFYSETQTNLANYFKSQVVDWLEDDRNKHDIDNNVLKYMKPLSSNPIKNYITKLGSDILTTTNCIPELYILSKIYSTINIYVYDDDNNILYIFSNGLVYNQNDNNNINSQIYKKYHDIDTKKKSIHIRFGFITSTTVPDEMDVLYFT